MGKLASVQVLRCVAVSMVVLHHYGSIEVGRAGVDLFFVISGFIMATVMPGKSPLQFARARLQRIFPPYFAALGLLFLLGQATPAIRPLIDSVIILPGGQLYIPQAWTLAFELTFYAGCAVYLIVGRGALLLLPIAWMLGWVGSYVGIAGSPLFLEFLLGVAVAYLPRRFGGFSLLLGVAALVVFQGQPRLFAYGVPASFLLHGAVCFEQQLKGWSVPILLGDASYSIYLTHWTFLAVLPAWPLPGYWLLNAYIAVLLGLAFYVAVERPLNLRRDRLIRMPTRQDAG